MTKGEENAAGGRFSAAPGGYHSMSGIPPRSRNRSLLIGGFNPSSSFNFPQWTAKEPKMQVFVEA